MSEYYMKLLEDADNDRVIFGSIYVEADHGADYGYSAKDEKYSRKIHPVRYRNKLNPKIYEMYKKEGLFSVGIPS